ncbi:MAG: hypothetical protein ACK4FB_07910 [Brevundimonas sp.]|uniref:hypothetical protein n=1 Tax=Brevundimonas sp. TaxID=1871086 RepID=UPI00391B8104
MTPPIPFIWSDDDGAFRPLNARFMRAAKEAYGDGEVVSLAPVEDRSAASHRHYFASINEAWQNIPEDMAEDFPTPEHLRKKALIRAGYRDERSFVCGSRAEAIRLAAFLRPVDDYAIVSVNGTSVVQLTAKSQSLRAMGKAAFQESKEAVLAVLSEMIGVTTQELHQAANSNEAQGKAA